MQSPFDRRNRDVQRGCDLAQGQLLVIKQLDGCPVARWEVLHRLENGMAKFVLFHHTLRIDDSVARAMATYPTHQAFKGKHVSLLIAQVASAHVERDAIKPAFETRGVSQVVEREIRLYDRLLRQFASDLFDGDQSIGDTPNHL